MVWQGDTYEDICRNFNWEFPEFFNIGVDICDKWADDKNRVALIYLDENDIEHKITYWELKNASNRLANALQGWGVEREDRIGILMAPAPETLISHIAVYKLGAILVPMIQLFGPMAIEYRLKNSGARGVITDRKNLPKILEIKDRLPELKLIIAVDAQKDKDKDILDFEETLEKGSRYFTPLATKPDDPALIIYTSGTTGPPKGALHGHRLMIAEATNTGFSLDLFPQKGDLLWTHCDWAYIAGSFTALYPTMHYGHAIVEYAKTGRFDAEKAFSIISKYGVTVIFAIATAFRIMMHAVKNPKERFDLDELRSITVGGENMGKDLYEWGQKALGVKFNENYGMTECDFMVANCSKIMDVHPGSMGRAIPGHIVEVIDEQGNVLPPDTYGEFAIKRPDPSIFLGYWGDPEATEKRFIGDWFRTGDYGTKDENGYFWFTGRKDYVIESGGYRIGPGEVEDALVKHAAVKLAAVIGVPDEIRGEIVKAFIVPESDVTVDKALEDDIKEHVKGRLEAHAYPREIEFLAEMPMTDTGKIMKNELLKLDQKRRAKAMP
ncbi:MAG: AMP-binding protein [Desulfobacterales bacterium]|nr:AMP-binding protein [Desulfobacterales bacterium]